MPNLYHSDLHLPRWKRVLLWLVETPIGVALWGIPLLLLVFAPSYWFGGWWLVLVLTAGVSFALGWNAARRRWLQDGRIDKV